MATQGGSDNNDGGGGEDSGWFSWGVSLAKNTASIAADTAKSVGDAVNTAIDEIVNDHPEPIQPEKGDKPNQEGIEKETSNTGGDVGAPVMDDIGTPAEMIESTETPQNQENIAPVIKEEGKVYESNERKHPPIDEEGWDDLGENESENDSENAVVVSAEDIPKEVIDSPTSDDSVDLPPLLIDESPKESPRDESPSNESPVEISSNDIPDDTELEPAVFGGMGDVFTGSVGIFGGILSSGLESGKMAFEVSKTGLSKASELSKTALSQASHATSEAIRQASEVSHELVNETFEASKLVVNEGMDAIEGIVDYCIPPEQAQQQTPLLLQDEDVKSDDSIDNFDEQLPPLVEEGVISPTSSEKTSEEDDSLALSDKNKHFMKIEKISNECLEGIDFSKDDELFQKIQTILTIQEDSEQESVSFSELEQFLAAGYLVESTKTAKSDFQKTLQDVSNTIVTTTSSTQSKRDEKIEVTRNSITTLESKILWSLNHVTTCSLIGLGHTAGRILELQKYSQESCLENSENLRKFYFFFAAEVSDLCEQFLEAIERIFDAVEDENSSKIAELQDCVNSVRRDVFGKTQKANQQIQKVVKLFVPIVYFGLNNVDKS